MIRTTFALLGLGCLGMLITAGLIRYELAVPGISGLFGDPDAGNTGARFNAAVALHGFTANLTFLLAGLALIAAVWPQLSALARLWLWGGLALVGVSAGLLVWVFLAADPTMVSSWVLYPPDAPLTAVTVFSKLMLEQTQAIIGTTACLIGAALVARASGAKGTVVAVIIGGTVATAGYALADGTNHLTFAALAVLFLLAFTPKIGAGMAHVFVGLLFAIGATRLFATLENVADPYFAGTYYEVAQSHASQSALGVMCILSAFVVWLRPRIHPALVWCHAAAMAAAMIASYAPMLFLGRQGMPRRYIDYSEVFADWNWVSSLGTLALLLLMVGGVVAVALRRT